MVSSHRFNHLKMGFSHFQCSLAVCSQNQGIGWSVLKTRVLVWSVLNSRAHKSILNPRASTGTTALTSTTNYAHPPEVPILVQLRSPVLVLLLRSPERRQERQPRLSGAT